MFAKTITTEVPMEFSIREATGLDYGGICTLCEEVDRLHRQHLPNIFKKPDGPARERDYIQSLLDDPNVVLFVAEVEAELIGFVNVMIAQSSIPLHVPRRFAIVDNLAVTEHFRRQGVGRALMQAAEHWAQERGATAMELNVYEFNHGATETYESLGYRTLSRKMQKSLAKGN